jgi:hypothetical protein
LRIEAASWKGRPAFFLVIQPWRESFFAAGQYVFPWQARVVMSLYMALTGAMLVIAIFLAARNYRMERVDGRGGFRLALFVIALSILEWLCLAKHHAAYTEYNSFVSALARISHGDFLVETKFDDGPVFHRPWWSAIAGVRISG